MEEHLAHRCSAQWLLLLAVAVTRVKDFSNLALGLLILVGMQRLGLRSGRSRACEVRRAGVTAAAGLPPVSRGDLGKPLRFTALLFPRLKKKQ